MSAYDMWLDPPDETDEPEEPENELVLLGDYGSDERQIMLERRYDR
ncbi:hypothetical protein [Pseudomonas sp. Au-Pse12]|nr:hypothetical protein [Pseudomonas sp. Au-Pse12]MCE4056325.1 hypothetical protein [Pseudomonas sp. Au-Pse12]